MPSVGGPSTVVWSLSVWGHREASGCSSYSTLSCSIQNFKLLQTQKLVFYGNNQWTSITSPKLKKKKLWEQKLNLATFLFNQIREVLKSASAFSSPPPPSCEFLQSGWSMSLSGFSSAFVMNCTTPGLILPWHSY